MSVDAEYAAYRAHFLDEMNIFLKSIKFRQSWTKVVETHENYQPFSLGVNSPLSPLVKGSFPFPLIQCWKQINIQEAYCNIVWGGGGGGG